MTKSHEIVEYMHQTASASVGGLHMCVGTTEQQDRSDQLSVTAPWVWSAAFGFLAVRRSGRLLRSEQVARLGGLATRQKAEAAKISRRP